MNNGVKIARQLVRMARSLASEGSVNNDVALDSDDNGKKYILHHKEGNLWRIQACKDFSNVKKGDFGGLVQSEQNLSQKGDCWVYDEAKVYGSAIVFENAIVSGNALVYDNAKISGNALVCDTAKVHGNAEIYDNAEVYGNAEVFDKVKVHGRVLVYGYAKVCGNAHVYGNAIVRRNAIVDSQTINGNQVVE